MYALAQFMSTLSGKIALVTGGGRGIGKAIALALAAAGCDVAVNYVSREADAQATSDAIRALGRRTLVAKGDVSKSADVTASSPRSKLALARWMSS